MFDNTKLQNNNRFQNFGTRDQLSAQNRNVFDRQSGNNFDGQSQDPHNFLTPVNPEPFNQNGVDHNSNHFNDPGLKDHHTDVHNNHQNTPTFLASSAQNKNQAHSPNNNEQTSGLSSQQNTQIDQFAPNSNFVGHQTSAQSNSHTQMNNPDLLNDQNIAKLQNNQLSGLTIHDIFPGMQMGKNQQILRPLSNPVNEFPSQHTHNDNFNQPNGNSFQSNSNFQNINQQSIQTASPKIENIQSTQTGTPKNENLQSLLQQVITKLLAANNNIGAAPVITQPVTHDIPPSSNNNNDLSSLGNSLSSNLNTMNILQQTPSTSTGMDNSHINPIGGIQPQKQANTLQQSPSTSTGMDNSHINPIGGKQPQNQANTLQSLLKNLLQKTSGSGGLAVNKKLIHTTQNMIGNKQQAPGSGIANQNQLNSIQNMIGTMQQTPGSGGLANQLHSTQNMLGNKQQAPGSSGQVENQNQLTPIQNMLGTMQLTPGSGGQASNQNQRLSIQNMLGTMQQTPGLSGQPTNQNQLNSLQNMLETMQQTPTLGGQTSNQNQVHSIQNMLGNIQQAPGSSGQTANQNQLNSIQDMIRNKQQAPGSSGQATNQNQLNSIQNMLGTMQQTPVLSGQASNQNQFHSIQNMLGGIQQAPGLGGQADNQNQLLSIQNMLGTMQLTPGSSGQATNQNQLNSIQNMLGTMQQTPGSGGQTANQNQLLTMHNMLGNKQNNVPSMSTTNFATKQQQFTGQPATISNSKSNPQDNLSVLLQTLLKQNNLGTNTNQDLQNSNQHFGLNGLLSNANMVPHTNINQQNNPNTLNTPTDTNLATAQRIVNIQMQNALQPHDFGLSGGHDISHINTFGHSTNNLAAQMNPNMLNIHNLLQGNPLLQSIASTQNQGRNMLIGHNLPQNNMLSNMMVIPITNNLQNSLNNNQGLRQLLQRNIQQILMKQNNQIVGAQGFLGLNNATKSFPNNQLAPSDVVIDNTTRNSTGTTFTPTSIKVGAIQTLNLTVNPTKPSLFSTFETFFPTKQVLVDTHGSLPMETLNTLPTKHVLDTHGSMPIETLNTLPTKHVLDTHGSMPMDTLNTLPTKHVLDTHGSMPMKTLNTLPTKHVLVETHGSIPIDTLNNSVAIIYHPNATTVNIGNNFGTLMDNITSTNNTGSEIYNLTRDLNTTANNNVTFMSNTSFIGIATYTNLTANLNDVINYTNMTDVLSNATLTSNATNATITLNATNDIVNSTTLYNTNVSSVNISDVLPTAPVVPVSSTSAKPHIIDISVSTTTKPSPLDILGPNGRLTSTLKKSLGIKNVDKATLKGLISNVLRDLFKQNFIDPVKGTLKASLNYTTMLNSVKKVLMKSKNKLLKLRQQVAISPAKMQGILKSRGLDVGSKHLQHVRSMSPSPLPVTKFVTTQPSIIKQPTLEAPTPAQLIVDSVGNHGVITNQHFGPTLGGGVAVWYSKPSKASPLVGSGSLSQYHQTNHLSNQVIQSSGDFSVNGMAAPSDINAIPVTSPDHAVSLFATSNPIGFNDLLNPVTHIPNIMTTVSSMQPQNHVSDPTLQFMAMSTPTSQISNLGWNIV
ncbi:probable cyclin-dependent serine/threonine-protein kinase DDB_G0292550 isoform X2 [Mytilus californianus]|uniref:probable cyclin-dependent serine/threonine-protein kinase DDB_G0292550 isoform X2 n=1 Tax=Mytilus californianus TaxID=6549 RepID=UPI0022485EA5|nr:probable cyclin-dependent serine/threonine-protein kinase DDB_G0292550 isoform X2 [Mytilus californianus]